MHYILLKKLLLQLLLNLSMEYFCNFRITECINSSKTNSKIEIIIDSTQIHILKVGV